MPPARRSSQAQSCQANPKRRNLCTERLPKTKQPVPQSLALKSVPNRWFVTDNGLTFSDAPIRAHALRHYSDDPAPALVLTGWTTPSSTPASPQGRHLIPAVHGKTPKLSALGRARRSQGPILDAFLEYRGSSDGSQRPRQQHPHRATTFHSLDQLRQYGYRGRFLSG